MGDDVRYDAAAPGAPGHPWRAARLLLAGFVVLVIAVAVLCIVEYSSLPDNVDRVLTQEEQAQVIADNSPLTDYVMLSPNADFPRDDDITKITIHHMAGDLSLEELGSRFSDRDRRASSNYAIDSDGNVALYVEEKNRAWTSSDRENDERAITIEVANDEADGDWHVSRCRLRRARRALRRHLQAQRHHRVHLHG